MSKNTVVRGMLVPSLKNKPLDGRQLVPTLGDIVNIENPHVGFLFYVESEGQWYEVVSLTDRIIDELTIPNDMVDEYKEFGKGMSEAEKEEYLTKKLATQLYLTKDESKKFVAKEDADNDYQPKGDYATNKRVDELEKAITGGGGDDDDENTGGGLVIDAPNDDKTYARKNNAWTELKDAPNDGFTYGRLNGEWAVIEGEGGVVTSLPIVTVNIGSSLGVDPVIDKVKAEVSYADKVFYIGNGGKVNVPYGLTATITFPQVSDYETPEPIVIENIMGDTTRAVEYKYVRSIVNVFVSADDSSSVDGQNITVEISSESDVLRNGVFIEDTDGNLYDIGSYLDDKTPNSIVLIDDKLKVRMAMYEYYSYWYGDSNTPESMRVPTADEALLYMNGEEDTAYFNTQLYRDAKKYAFPNGVTGTYVASSGELAVIQKYWNVVVSCFLKFGISMKNLIHSSTHYNVSGYNGYPTWNMDMLTGMLQTSSNDPDPYFLFLRKITNEDKFKTLMTSEYEVVGGQVSFSCLKNDSVTVSIDSKGENYSRPKSVSFVSDGTNKNISMIYNLLVIDTIYINNLIADTSSIISGEMNGKAVQAIWNNVHRYLGKIVTKEDSTNELVLLDIDQNDNRYYADGSMIDLESLGTDAYFFTKIPAMSYKITQMSDNIYKVQISYKHKPEGDGWKHFDELIMPTFASKGGEISGDTDNSGFPIYYKDVGLRYIVNNVNSVYIRPIDSIDYSTLVLMCYAKYGIDNDFSSVNESVLSDSFASTGSERVYLLNGFSLAYGVKDTRFKTESFYDRILYTNSILGLENFFKPSVNMYFDGDTYRQSYFPLKTWNNNKMDDCVVYTPTTNNISIISYEKDLDRNYTIAAFPISGYIKSLIIDDFFHCVPKEVGGTSETYYKSLIIFYNLLSYDTHYINPTKMIKSLGYYNPTSYPGRVKIVCPNRIESDRESFEALTNIWK